MHGSSWFVLLQCWSSYFVIQFFYDPSPLGLSFEDIANRAGQLPEPLTLSDSRVVVHIQTTHQAVDDFIAVVLQLAEEKKRAGFVRANANRKDSGNMFIYGGR
jgi:threonine aldolase